MKKRNVLYSIICLIAILPIAWAQGQGDQNSLPGQHAKTDRLLAAVQKICPVSGEPLGSMGDPVKAAVGEQTVFLCCEGCRGKKADPAHWQTIKGNLAKAQKVCPIMGKPVDGSGNAIVASGHLVFVCCPNCIAKIQADPNTALTKVLANYASSLADEVEIAAQGICPVSGEVLGSMGEPIRAKAGEEAVFLCCKGCVGKPAVPDHWTTIQENLKKAQAVCPVKGEPLPADAASIVVDGRRIFVCCPSCIDEIKADGPKYLAKISELYLASAQRSSASQSSNLPEHSENSHHDHK